MYLMTVKMLNILIKNLAFTYQWILQIFKIRLKNLKNALNAYFQKSYIRWMSKSINENKDEKQSVGVKSNLGQYIDLPKNSLIPA